MFSVAIKKPLTSFTEQKFLARSCQLIQSVKAIQSELFAVNYSTTFTLILLTELFVGIANRLNIAFSCSPNDKTKIIFDGDKKNFCGQY